MLYGDVDYFLHDGYPLHLITVPCDAPKFSLCRLWYFVPMCLAHQFVTGYIFCAPRNGAASLYLFHKASKIQFKMSSTSKVIVSE